jgi:heterodisulfide reductase subunit A-like polyferredoxin
MLIEDLMFKMTYMCEESEQIFILAPVQDAEIGRVGYGACAPQEADPRMLEEKLIEGLKFR